MTTSRTLCLKIDVDTHEGMRDGVPRLLTLLARQRCPATFFLSFGPDNAGKAMWNLLRPGFLAKMLRTRAPSLYGLRTILSGTLLPARPTAAAFPDLVRRIAAEGHEVGIHAWDHRRWQDHIESMDAAEIRAHFDKAMRAFEAALHRPPRACAAPAWAVTTASLRIQDELGFLYASDLRGGPPCRLRTGGAELRTIQIPTTGRCLEEILAGGITDEAAIEAALFEDATREDPSVLALHAEVEGGPFAGLLDRLLSKLRATGAEFQTLESLASRLEREPPPVRDLTVTRLPGRWSLVATSSANHESPRSSPAPSSP